MRRTVAVIMVLAVIVVAVIALSQGPRITTEALTVTVATGPDDDAVALDARLYLPEQTPAPAVLLAHGFGSDRTALDDTARTYAAEGYVVLTWSARGFGASGGQVGLNDPDGEVADVSALVDALSDRPEVSADSDGDPVVGIAGGSYGGGVALLAAAREPRIDAVVAAATWHSLAAALAPNRAGRQAPGVWKEQWASVLFTAGAAGPDLAPGNTPGPTSAPAQPLRDPSEAGCGRFRPDLCQAYARTAISGIIDEDDRELLDRSSLEGHLAAITAPTMLIAGQDDTLFGLEESLHNVAGITAPLALRWVTGDHGEASRIDGDDARRWLDVHLRGADHDLPRFSWVDEVSGTVQRADELPTLYGSGPRGDSALTLTPTVGGLLATAAPPGDGEAPDGDASDEAPAAEGDPPDRDVLLRRPPGGLPASLSTLPGLGRLGDLLPNLDIPGQAASFTSEPLPADVTLLGGGALTLTLDAPIGEPLLFIKLFDVSPGGQARLLQSAVNPTRLADVPATVTLPLEPLAHRITAGNRLRLTLATTDQAYAGGRDPAVLVVDTRNASLVLPTIRGTLVSPLPAAVRIAMPVLLVLAASLAAWGMTRRHEQRLAMTPAISTDPIVIRGLVKRYRDGKVAVDGLDLTVGRGQVFGLLGPNGAGKTTTMRMLLGLIHPTEGTIRLLGRPLHAGHPVLARVGVLVEGPGFAPYLTGLQNLRSFWGAGGRPWSEAAVDRALAVADLGPAINRPTRTYSHGMRQRLAIAQALLGDPELLVLDEPTDGLDPEQIRAMRQLLARLGAEGITILVSSHLLAEVEQMCTHVAVVNSGRVVAAGPVADLMGATRSMVIQTDDRERARVVLTDLLEDGAVDVQGSGLAVRLDDTSPQSVIAALVQAGIGVSAATPRGRLEDTFLALTGGDT